MSTSLTPMLEQYYRIKREHQDAILMFRMGDFYEMFFDDALDASRILEIALTSRGKGTDNEAPMCGVPHHAVDSYIARLIASGRKVAVCDQVEDARKAKGLVRREVVRVVSPGTLTDPAALDARDNLYIGCLFPGGDGLGAAFIDLSAGDFRLAERRGPRAWEEIGLLMTAFRPREVLHPEDLDPAARLGAAVASGVAFTSLPAWVFGLDGCHRLLTEQMGTRSLAGFGCEGMDLGVRAGGALVHHLKDTQRSALTHIHRVLPHRSGEYMALDAPTLRTLEVVRPLSGAGRSGTLLSVLDRTITSMGARRLQSWLLSPSLSLFEIRRRLDAVEELLSEPGQRERIRSLLKGIKDIERLLGRVTLGSAGARDLVALRDSLAPLPDIADTAARLSAPLLTGHPGPLASEDTATPPAPLDPLRDLHTILCDAIEDDPPATLHEGGMIRDGYDADLDELRRISRDGKSYIAGIESRERERTGIPTLKVRYNRVFGYYIEVSTLPSRAGARRLRTQADAGQRRAVRDAGAQGIRGEGPDGPGQDPRDRVRPSARAARAGGGPIRPARGNRRARGADRRDRLSRRGGGRARLRPSRGGRGAPDPRLGGAPSGGGGDEPRERFVPNDVDIRRRDAQDSDRHRSEHGRQVDLPEAGGADHPHGPGRLVRAGRPRGDRHRRPDILPHRLIGQPRRRTIDVHGGDAGDGQHPQQRDRPQPDPAG